MQPPRVPSSMFSKHADICRVTHAVRVSARFPGLHVRRMLPHLDSRGGYQTVAGCTPAPPPSHGRPMRGVRDLAFPSWHFWAGLQGVTHLYASLARRLSSALLPPSPQAERDSCVGFCLQPGPPILPSFVTRASPWPLWELGFCLWDEGAEPGKPRVPAGVSHSPPHHCAGLLSGITTPHQESEWRWVLA